jgi:beta-glucanase (GH16 family)
MKRTILGGWGAWRACALACATLAACSDADGEEEADGAEPIEVADAAADATGRDAGRDAGRGAAEGGAPTSDAATLDAAASDDAGPRDAGTHDARAEAGARDASASDGAVDSGDNADTGATADSGAPSGWKLVWSDEFDGPAGSLLNASRWVYETGGGGWGNNQLEFDTNRAENASLDGMGELVITARKESYMGRDYTSARVKTQGKFEHGYGRYEARMRIPFGQGIWPAFWMLGADIGSANWPTCGEIDIMENIGREPDTVHGTIHGPGYSGGAGIGAANKVAQGRFADDYHVFAIEWEKEVIRWYVDGKLYQTRTPKDLPGGARWVYDHNFFILLNLAVGGQWPGNPDGTSTYPQTLKVDYVRVYDRG